MVAALPVVAFGRRSVVRARVGTPARSTWRAVIPARFRADAPWVVARGGGPVLAVARDLRRRRRDRVVDAAVARELPVALDLLGVAVDAGCTPFLAVDTAARWGPPVVAASCVAV